MKYMITMLLISILLVSSVKAQKAFYQENDNRIAVNVYDYYYNKAYEHLNKKQYNDALDAATVSINLCPSCGITHALMSVVYNEMGDTKKAAKEFAIAKKQCNNCAEVYFEIACRKVCNGSYNEAIAIINDGLRKDSLSKKASAFYYDRGIIKSWQNDGNGWYTDCKKAYDADTNNLDALFNMMDHEAYLHQNNLVYKRLASLKVDSSRHYYPWYILHRRAGVYLELKKYDNALEDSKSAVLLNPLFFGVYVNKALSEVFLGKYQEALVDIDTAINKEPQNTWAINNRGFIKIHTQQYESALKDFDTTLALDSNVHYAYNNKGYVYFKLGGKENLKKAIELYDKALEIGGKDYEPYWKFREDALIAFKASN